MCIICYGLALIASIAVALAVYGLSMLGWCYLSRQRTSRTVGEKSFGSMRLQPYLYSTFKYRKGVEDDAKDEAAPEMDCVVCLTGFEDGEDVKQLPRCKHSFHAPCIDMWLYSHSDCPLCRSTVDRRDPYSEENSNSQVAMLDITIST